MHVSQEPRGFSCIPIPELVYRLGTFSAMAADDAPGKQLAENCVRYIIPLLQKGPRLCKIADFCTGRRNRGIGSNWRRECLTRLHDLLDS